jgi:hypothetical protein
LQAALLEDDGNEESDINEVSETNLLWGNELGDAELESDEGLDHELSDGEEIGYLSEDQNDNDADKIPLEDEDDDDGFFVSDNDIEYESDQGEIIDEIENSLYKHERDLHRTAKKVKHRGRTIVLDDGDDSNEDECAMGLVKGAECENEFLEDKSIEEANDETSSSPSVDTDTSHNAINDVTANMHQHNGKLSESDHRLQNSEKYALDTESEEDIQILRVRKSSKERRFSKKRKRGLNL